MLSDSPLPSKWSCPPTNGFSQFVQNTTFFSKNVLNNKISGTEFVIKKVMLIFCVRFPFSLQNGQMCSQNIFSCFLRKYCL